MIVNHDHTPEMSSLDLSWGVAACQNLLSNLAHFIPNRIKHVTFVFKSLLPKRCQLPDSFVMMSELLGLTSGSMSTLCASSRDVLTSSSAMESRSTTKTGLNWGVGGREAAGLFPCRLLESGFWYPLPFQGQCSDLEGRLQRLFIFPGSLLQWERGRGVTMAGRR